MEEQEVEEYDHIKHGKSVAQLIQYIREDQSLDLFFPDSYVDNHRMMILNTLSYYNRSQKIGFMLDRETLTQMFTIQTDSLKTLLYNLTRYPFVTDKEVNIYLVIRFVLREAEERPGMLHWRIMLPLDDNVIDSDFVRHTHTVSVLYKSIDQYKTMYRTTMQDLDHFIESSTLIDYYGKGYLTERKEEILQWLAKMFQSYDLLFRLDDMDPYLYQQLFTHLTSPDYILLSLIHEKILHERRPNAPFVKKEVIVKCQQIRCKSPMLLEQLDSPNRHLFTNVEEYSRIIKGTKDVFVDVCQVRRDNILQCITVLPKSPYKQILRNLNARRQFDNDLRELDDRDRIRRLAEKTRIESLCNDKVNSFLRSIPERHGREELRIDESINRFLGARLFDMNDGLHGADSNCKIIEGCVNRTISKANELIQQRGIHSFTGSMELTRRVIDLDGVNEQSFPRHMNDSETQLMINDHLKANSRISTLNYMYGDDWLSHCIVPCVANPHSYYAENMLVNNGTIDNRTINVYRMENVTANQPIQETISLPKKKRKRKPTIVEEPVKRFKLIREKDLLNHNDVDADVDLDDMIVIVLKTEKIRNPDWTETRRCPMCNQARLLKSFSDTTTKGLARVKPVCNSCNITWHKHNK